MQHEQKEEPKTWYKVSEIAKRLRVDERTVRSLINQRELTAVRVGRVVRIHREELERYLGRQL